MLYLLKDGQVVGTVPSKDQVPQGYQVVESDQYVTFGDTFYTKAKGFYKVERSAMQPWYIAPKEG